MPTPCHSSDTFHSSSDDYISETVTLGSECTSLPVVSSQTSPESAEAEAGYNNGTWTVVTGSPIPD
jgi:hypothetical protein